LKGIVQHEEKAHSAVAILVPIVAVEAVQEVIVEEVSPEAVVVVSGAAVADAEDSAGWFRSR
jgi:major membrane immunogen (membrane-anchored lipoprotein)